MSSLSTHWEPGLDLEHQFPRAREGLGYKAVPMASIIDRQGTIGPPNTESESPTTLPGNAGSAQRPERRQGEDREKSDVGNISGHWKEQSL